MRNFFKKWSSSNDGAQKQAADSTQKQATDGVKKQATILIVDDSPTEIHVMKGLLEPKNYTIVTAGSGEEGIEMALRIKPDLILMDVVMPGMNGFKATRQLSKNPDTAGIPVIMVTTKDQDTDRAWALRQGAKDYVVKPVAADLLFDKIRTYIASRG